MLRRVTAINEAGVALAMDLSNPELSGLVVKKITGLGPADGVIARDEIARVLIDSLSTDGANRKTLELAAEVGLEQEDLTDTFEALVPDAQGSLDGALDKNLVSVAAEPKLFRDELARLG